MLRTYARLRYTKREKTTKSVEPRSYSTIPSLSKQSNGIEKFQPGQARGEPFFEKKNQSRKGCRCNFVQIDRSGNIRSPVNLRFERPLRKTYFLWLKSCASNFHGMRHLLAGLCPRCKL